MRRSERVAASASSAKGDLEEGAGATGGASAAAATAAAAAAASLPPPLPPALPPLSLSSCATGPSLSGDWHNFILLLFLYTLQGIPIGLASSVPLFLQARGASFSEQATFGLASWPYSLKLLWAPLVDALYTTRWGLGHRKSWVIPMQLAAGIIMLVLGAKLDDVFGGPAEGGGRAGAPIDVPGLTTAFFLLYILVATQDIAVDGWALSLLRPENVGYASTANTVGQSAGVMAAYGLLMALDSPAFCDAWLRGPLGLPGAGSGRGLVSIATFMQACGGLFMLSTLALWALLKEAPPVVGGGGGAGGEAPGAGGGALAPGGEAQEGAGLNAAGRGAGASALSAASGGSAGAGSSVRRRTPRTSAERAAAAAAGGGAAGEGGGAPSAGRRRSVGSSAGSHRRGQAAAGAASALPATEAVASLGGDPAEFHASGNDQAEERVPLAAAPRAAPSSAEALGARGDALAQSQAPALSPAASALASVRAAYADLGLVVSLPPVRWLVLVLVSAKLGFTATDAATGLVLQWRGESEETVAAFHAPSTPLQLAFPLLISRLVAGPRPLGLWSAAFPLRLLGGLALLALVYLGLPGGGAPGAPPPSAAFLVALFLATNAHALVGSAMFLAQISFFTRCADPAMGGSYMTLLNTVANLGSMWPRWFVLNAIQALSQRACLQQPGAAAAWSPEAAAALTCASAGDTAACAAVGGACTTVADGYPTIVLVSCVVGVIWWLAMRPTLRMLEEAPRGAWIAVGVEGRGGGAKK